MSDALMEVVVETPELLIELGVDKVTAVVYGNEFDGRRDFRRHSNPDGTLGGWTELTVNIDGRSTIGPTVIVEHRAYVRQCVLLDRVRVSAYSQLTSCTFIGPFQFMGHSTAHGEFKFTSGGAHPYYGPAGSPTEPRPTRRKQYRQASWQF